MPEQSKVPDRPDSTPLVDPLHDLFNEDQVKYAEDIQGDVPQEILDAIESFDLPDLGFRAQLKRVPETAQDIGGQAVHLGSWRNRVPSIDYVGKVFGPGTYTLVLTWRIRMDEEKKFKNQAERITFSVGDEWADIHGLYNTEQKIKYMRRQKDTIRKARMDNLIDSSLADELMGEEDKKQTETVDPIEAGKKFVAQTMESAQMLGLTKAEQGNGFTFEKLLGIAIPLLPNIMSAFSNAAQSRNQMMEKFMMVMLNQANSNNSQLIEMMKASQGQGSGSHAVQEFKDMIFGAIDVKQALNGNKESVVDKLFKVVESVAPQVLHLASVSQQKRQQSLPYQMAKTYVNNSPDFQALRDDPQLLVQLVGKLDRYYGWEQADAILQVGEMQRPPECPRREEQRFPAGDERNARDQGQDRGMSDVSDGSDLSDSQETSDDSAIPNDI